MVARWRTPKRLIPAVVIAAVAGVAVYAAVAPGIGLEWPYPQRLPATLSLHGWYLDQSGRRWSRGDTWKYDQASGCRSYTWWNHHDKHFHTIRRWGTMPSALGIGGSPLFAQPADLHGVGGSRGLVDLWAKTSQGCYVLYQPRPPTPP